jgi:hypothetical protein
LRWVRTISPRVGTKVRFVVNPLEMCLPPDACCAPVPRTEIAPHVRLGPPARCYTVVAGRQISTVPIFNYGEKELPAPNLQSCPSALGKISVRVGGVSLCRADDPQCFSYPHACCELNCGVLPLSQIPG